MLLEISTNGWFTDADSDNLLSSINGWFTSETIDINTPMFGGLFYDTFILIEPTD